MLLNCGVGEDSWESLGLRGDPTSPSLRKSVLNIHWKDWFQYSLEYYVHLMGRTDSLEKTLMLGRIEGRRRRGWQRTRRLDGITDSMDRNWASSGGWWWTGRPGVLRSTGSQRGVQDWTAVERCVLTLAPVIPKLLPTMLHPGTGRCVHSAERHQWWPSFRNRHLSCTDTAGMYKSMCHDSSLASDESQTNRKYISCWSRLILQWSSSEFTDPGYLRLDFHFDDLSFNICILWISMIDTLQNRKRYTLTSKFPIIFS